MDNYELELLFELAEEDDLFAMRKLARCYMECMNDSKENIFEFTKDKKNYKWRDILSLLKFLIEKGDSDSMLVLGGIYYSGGSGLVEQDYVKASYWYNESLKNKPLENLSDCHSEAINNLGYCYYYGRTAEPDYKKAFMYYAKAACLYHPNAMYKIGDMYREGLYIDKDINKAFHWYTKSYSYSRNDPYVTASVSLRLGRAYLGGEGTKISLLKALKYLQLAERHFYSLLINKPVFSNSSFADIPFKQVQELLEKVREQLNNKLNSGECFYEN